MNQYDFLIRDYLYEQKTVSFEKIGTLSIADKSKAAETQQPQGNLIFEFDKRATTSPGLITYIAERTNKNKGLILSDLESYIELMRQFINIGKPYEMDGVGVFKLAKSNEYEFVPYDGSEPTEEQKIIKRQQIKNNSSLVVKKGSDKRALMFLAVLIILGVIAVIGWGSYKLFMGKSFFSSTPDTTATITTPIIDTPVLHPDTTLNADTTATTAPPTIIGDTSDYKFIFETTTSPNRAALRTQQFNKSGKPSGYDSTATDSGFVYHLYFKMRLKNSDTTATKDSLMKYLTRNIKIVRVK